MRVGERVKMIRESRNLSTTKLAKMAGMAQSTLRDLELGKTTATEKTIEKLSKALNVPVPELVGLYEIEEPEAFNQLILDEISRLNDIQKHNLLAFLRSI